MPPSNSPAPIETETTEICHAAVCQHCGLDCGQPRVSEVDFSWGTPRAAYGRLKDHPGLRVSNVERGYRLTTVLNKKHGLFTNVRLRQVVLAALDMNASLRAAVEHPDLYRLDASLFSKESPWWTDVGREQYNQQAPEKARRLLHEAGYRGESLRYMTNQDIPHQDKLALTTKTQLEAVGFTVELQKLEQGHARSGPGHS
jgi:ABC-type transport system substrate-binding protein